MTGNSTGIIYDLQGSTLIRRVITTPFPAPTNLCGRSAITRFSSRSASRMRRYLRTCLPVYRVMLTLTYPDKYPRDGRVVKYHLRRFVERYRNQLVDEFEFSFFWFLEFQSRGAPHFHAFITHPVDFRVVARIWNEIAAPNDNSHLLAGTRIEFIRSGRGGTVSYASKYASKLCQKAVPFDYISVGRFWGVIGDSRCMAATIAFSSAQILTRDPTYELFLAELRRILQGKKLIRYQSEHSFTVVVVIPDAAAAKIRTLMARMVMKGFADECRGSPPSPACYDMPLLTAEIT